ncbi:MAG: hypothetical protein HOC70_17605 [Gammaproteobacteria bacterium]|jgi:Bax protein|nr:hypothetical protein [Gammaproteobacteria bacterium]
MILRRTDIAFLSLLLALAVVGWLKSNQPVQELAKQPVTFETDTQPVVEPGRASTILPIAKVTSPSLPDFAAIHDVRTKKREFFDFMLPMIRHSNDAIRQQRHELLAIRDNLRAGVEIDAEAHRLIGGISRHYRVRPGSALLNQVDELLIRVDVVPESLVLAQSANESGWGTSRFAREANNLFGVWCFRQGCGIKPLSRDDGLTHEVARYDSVQHSVDAYIRTINTNPAYEELRQIRAGSRAGAVNASGMALAEGLLRYSSRGIDYVREIQQMIRVNRLHEYNLPV